MTNVTSRFIGENALSNHNEATHTNTVAVYASALFVPGLTLPCLFAMVYKEVIYGNYYI